MLLGCGLGTVLLGCGLGMCCWDVSRHSVVGMWARALCY